MTIHKYKIGQSVQYMPDKSQAVSAGSDYKITRLLPSLGSDQQYRIKCVSEPYERVAQERQLSRS